MSAPKRLMTSPCLHGMSLTRKAFSVCLGDYHVITCMHMMPTCFRKNPKKNVGTKPFLRRVAVHPLGMSP